LSHCPYLFANVSDWGLLATGIFCTDENIQYAAYPNTNEACASGEQFGVQAVGGLVIIVWTCVTAGATFVAVNAIVGMRVSADVEGTGLDVSEHGAVGDAWAPGAPLKVEAAGTVKPTLNANPSGGHGAPMVYPQGPIGYAGGGQYGNA